MGEHAIDLHPLVRHVVANYETPLAVICWYAELLAGRGFLVETGLQPQGGKTMTGPQALALCGMGEMYLRWRRPRGRWIGRLLVGVEHVRLTPLRRLPRGFPGAIEHADPVGYERLERAVLELGEQR